MHSLERIKQLAGLNEALSIDQAGNIVGQTVPDNIKRDLLPKGNLKERIKNALVNITQNFDPKQSKIIAKYILQQHIKDLYYIEEDQEIIKNTIESYFKNRQQIDRKQKSLTDYTYNELKRAIASVKKDEGEYREFLSKPILQNETFKVYKITDVDTCVRIGQGTSWCIQGEQWAKDYLSKGPLYLITKDGYKYALLHFKEKQFMDIHDEKLSINQIKELQGLGIDELTDDPDIKIMFDKNPSEEIQLSAVKQDGYAIQYIKNPTKEIQLAAVEQKGILIYFIKNPSEMVQLVAVKKSKDSINYIENPTSKVLALQKKLWG